MTMKEVSMLVNEVTKTVETPSTFKEAMQSDQSERCKDACNN